MKNLHLRSSLVLSAFITSIVIAISPLQAAGSHESGHGGKTGEAGCRHEDSGCGKFERVHEILP